MLIIQGLIFVLLVICLICLKDITALSCFECDDVFKPYSCNFVTKCTDGEECYLDQYVTSSGTILFKSGCRSTQRCSVAKREVKDYDLATNISTASDTTSDIIVCSTCCKDRDYCNLEGCQEHMLQKQNRGPLCFDCLNQGKLTCRHVTQCDLNYACEISSREQNGVEFYDSRCVHLTSLMNCNTTNQRSLPSFVGKRATGLSNYCPKCCVDDFCNEDCTSPPNNGGFGDWGSWSACSNTCGGMGQQQRTRPCRHSPCIGPTTDTRDCVTKGSCTVGSVRETWTSWSSCSASCGGTKRRSKICYDSTGYIDQSLCTAPIKEEVSCNSLYDCEYRQSKICFNSKRCINTSLCTAPIKQEVSCNSLCDCSDGWDLWHRWTGCSSRNCGQGYQWRNRHCDKGKSHDQCVGYSQEWRNCNSTENCNDSGYSSWGAWSTCSRTCAQGARKYRLRTCINGSPGTGDCEGNKRETILCNQDKPCPRQLCESIPNYNDYHFVIHSDHKSTWSDLCLHYSTEMLDWSTASSKCHAEGGKLAVLDSVDEDEEAFDNTYHVNYPVKDVKIWIGLRYVNGRWSWEDGSTIGTYAIATLGKNYTEVVSMGFTNGACVLDHDRHWSLVDCNEKHYYMCERDVMQI